MLRPTKGYSVPIQKEGTGPKSCRRRRNTAKNPKGVAGLPKVMERGGRRWYGDVVVEKMELSKQRKQEEEALLVASLLAAGSKEEEEEVK